MVITILCDKIEIHIREAPNPGFLGKTTNKQKNKQWDLMKGLEFTKQKDLSGGREGRGEGFQGKKGSIDQSPK